MADDFRATLIFHSASGPRERTFHSAKETMDWIVLFFVDMRLLQQGSMLNDQAARQELRAHILGNKQEKVLFTKDCLARILPCGSSGIEGDWIEVVHYPI
jgi:hypothetical protein